MTIIITQWALDSYLSLLHRNVFSATDYWNTIRPDILLLRNYPAAIKFQNGKFWSPAQGRSGIIANGYKMKWHQIGPGRVQLRLPIVIIGSDAFLCEAYVKANPRTEQRKLARFQVHRARIQRGQFSIVGTL